MAFLEKHAAGQDLANVPNIPTYLTSGAPMDVESAELQAFTFETPVYDSTSITPDVARRVQRFYLANGFLPPPRHPLEHLRSEIIHDYDLHSPEQVNNIQASLNVLQAFYGGVAAFTLFEQSIQVLNAVSGPPALLETLDLYPGKRIIPETSLCGHACLSSGPVFLPNFDNDWRFHRNPFLNRAASSAAKEYINTHESLAAYLGIPVTLRLDPASTTDMSVVSIGVINILITDPTIAVRATSPGQSMVLDEITRMLSTQLRSTWDCAKRSREASARSTVADFIEQTLARPCVQRITNDLEGRGAQADSLKEFAQLACTQICGVLSEAQTATIIDLRLFGGDVSRACFERTVWADIYLRPTTWTRDKCLCLRRTAKHQHSIKYEPTFLAPKPEQPFPPSCVNAHATRIVTMTSTATPPAWNVSFPAARHHNSSYHSCRAEHQPATNTSS